MSKYEKQEGIQKVAEVRRLPAPPIRKTGKGRGKNFEAADAALREKIEASEKLFGRRSHYRAYLPEAEGMRKVREQKRRATKCVCGHRGSTHHRSRYDFAKKILIQDICNACPFGECNGLKEAA